AIMAAMEDPEVDTIYLLTDGVPTQGEVVDAEEILEAVMRENRTRQVIIHCISVGMKSTLLMDLAALTGGQYKEVL
ncbi:MAG: Mg-chelatase subunit ChlD, partial [Planctomycetota bacterium]